MYRLLLGDCVDAIHRAQGAIDDDGLDRIGGALETVVETTGFVAVNGAST